jgi:hypothetical protein
MDENIKMAKHTELKNQLRKESGIDFTKDRLQARRWIAWLKDNQNTSLRNLGFALDFGLKTGRLPNINFEGELTNPKTGKPLSNLQTVTAFAKAATTQTENTTAASCKALQAAFNLRTM